MSDKLKALYVLDAFNEIYDIETRTELGKLCDFIGPQYNQHSVFDHLDNLRDCEVIFSGWGCPKIDETILQAAPKLRYIFYGAGSIRCFATDAMWDRGIRVSSAWGANALPVAEYTLSAILFGLKRGFSLGRAFTASRGENRRAVPVAGGYGSTVGIVSAGMIGRRVIELLRPFDVKVQVYDPYLSEERAAALGVKRTSLDELFRTSDVVSLHTPWLEETVGMITGAHIASMKPGAVFINTSRGAIVREPEMIEVLQQRPDLFALLDVTWPEPPVQDSPLWTLPNVLLTPHIAGSMAAECARHGRYMLEECRRYIAGEKQQWEVTREMAKTMA